MSMRLAPKLREDLVAETVISGRSLTEEIELRLARSFHNQAALQEALENAYGAQGAALLMLLGRIIRSAPGGYKLSVEADWLSDINAFDRAATGIVFALEALRPLGDPLPAERSLSQNMAARLLTMFVETPRQSWVATLLVGFGEAVAQRLTDWSKKYRDALYGEEEATQ
jgi:hypothetical protein